MLTRQDLGVPEWFSCDACSGPTPDRWFPFTVVPCDRHDWDHFRGSREDSQNQLQSASHRNLRANIKTNAQLSAKSWLQRQWKPIVGEAYYWGVVVGARKAWRIRERNNYSMEELEQIALAEGKHATNPR